MMLTGSHLSYSIMLNDCLSVAETGDDDEDEDDQRWQLRPKS